MRSRTRMIAAGAAVTAALAAGGSAAVASSAGAKPGAPAKAMSASQKPRPSAAEERQGHDAIVAAVASTLHVSAAQVSAALQPMFAAGYADPASPAFAAAAQALGVSTAELNSALIHAKLSQTAAVRARQACQARARRAQRLGPGFQGGRGTAGPRRDRGRGGPRAARQHGPGQRRAAADVRGRPRGHVLARVRGRRPRTRRQHRPAERRARGREAEPGRGRLTRSTTVSRGKRARYWPRAGPRSRR